jgi:arabinose-5-phosphate isomerase
MLAAGDAIAALLTDPHTFNAHDFARFHPGGSLGLSLISVEAKTVVTREVLVPRTATIPEVLERMTVIGKGIVGVVSDEGILIGSVTDGDIRRFFLAHTSHEGLFVDALMNTEPKHIRKDMTLQDALKRMEDYTITNLFVTEHDGAPIGVIHIHDILKV